MKGDMQVVGSADRNPKSETVDTRLALYLYVEVENAKGDEDVNGTRRCAQVNET